MVSNEKFNCAWMADSETLFKSYWIPLGSIRSPQLNNGISGKFLLILQRMMDSVKQW